jgi:putative heme-binding domain-containing protein
MTNKTAETLSGIVRKVKLRGLYTDNQWPIRLQQLVTALLRRDSGLGNAFVDLPVPCCPEDLVLLNAFPVDVQANAKKKMREHLFAADVKDWSIPILRYATQNGFDEAFASQIRNAASDPRCQTVATELLSAQGRELDYPLFLAAMESGDHNQWTAGWKGISTLPVADPIREQKAFAPVVSSVINSAIGLPRSGVLQRARLIATKLDSTRAAPVGEQWSEWETFFQSTLDQDSFAKLVRPKVTIDWKAMVKQANQIPGDSQLGQTLYQEKCGLCHGGQSSLGPSLLGVTKRFSRDDLARSIFEPSKDISDRYRAIRVLTVDGEIFTGMIVYTAADGTTLQTGTGAIVRINQADIEDRAYSTESLMPAGILDDKSPQDLSNLFAYLSTMQ